MEAVILEILKNADHPVIIVLSCISEFVKAMEVATKERIYFKNAVFTYYTDQGYERKRVMKDTFEVWLQQDVEDLQEQDLKKLKPW
jgi:hypothetical protein